MDSNKVINYISSMYILELWIFLCTFSSWHCEDVSRVGLWITSLELGIWFCLYGYLYVLGLCLGCESLSREVFGQIHVFSSPTAWMLWSFNFFLWNKSVVCRLNISSNFLCRSLYLLSPRFRLSWDKLCQFSGTGILARILLN